VWLSRKNLGQLAALYDLVTRAKNKTAATCKAQKMVLGYRSCDVANTDRENTHSNLKGLAQMAKRAPGATEEV
jgi:hypothetical protein